MHVNAPEMEGDFECERWMGVFFSFPLLRDRNIETEIVKIVKRRVHIDLQQENFAVNQGNGRI